MCSQQRHTAQPALAPGASALIQAALPSATHCCARSKHSLLFLSPVWPEPSSSAAGVRTSELISGFQGCGAEVTYVSTSADSPENEHTSRLRQAGVQVHQCPANREQQLQAVIEACQPSVCIFDR